MYNAPRPMPDQLPSKVQLRRASIIAAMGAAAIFTMVYLPAEQGKDPTGVGSLLGLTEMGEIKQQLAAEAAADEPLHDGNDSASLMDGLLDLLVPPAAAQNLWRDEIVFTLAPGAHTEIKARMDEGATLDYRWTATGGRINFDLHAHSGDQAVTYDKGRGKASGEGSITTPFAGNHGWFWRNRDDSDVTVTLKLNGDYRQVETSK